MATPAIASDTSGTSVHSGTALRRFVLMLRAVALFCGFFAFWTGRNVMYSDGISYLDIADLYARGAWKSAINEYWSPLFSWLLAASMKLIHPPARYEVLMFHVVLLAGYIAALWAFGYFIDLLVTTTCSLDLRFSAEPALQRVLLMAGYAAFIWATMPLVGMCTPDVFVSALVYLLSGMLLRGARDPVRLGFCAAIGALIGAGWLTKAALLPIGIAALAVFALSIRRWRRPLVPVLCSAVALAAVCLPFVVAMRITKGHWTFGKAAALNYSWEVNGVTRSYHWQGGAEGSGKPLHPTRQINTSPPVYEFAMPLPVTYAPWFDPAYWYEGLRVTFDGGRQLRAFGINFSLAMMLLLTAPGLVPALLLWIHRGKGFSAAGSWARLTGGAWVLCGFTVLSYSLVFVEPRYIGAPLAVLSCLLLAPALAEAKPMLIRRIRWCSAASVFPCVWFCWRPVFLGAAFLLFNATGMEPNPNGYWKEAQYLESAGMRPGDTVGVIGMGVNAYWARLLHARIVAEIPARVTKTFELTHVSHPDPTDINDFWSAPPQQQRAVLDAFARVGVRWMVAEPVPSWVKAGDGWTELPFARKGESEFGSVTRTLVRRLDSGFGFGFAPVVGVEPKFFD